MSLHAELSPEALARLRAQQRNSTITSIIIAILVVTLIGIILLLYLLPPVNNYTPEIVSYQGSAETKEKTKNRKITREIQRKPSAPTMARVIVANTTATTAIPIPDMDVPDPSLDLGMEDEFEDTTWAESGESGFSAIPETMRERCSRSDRLHRLNKNGGNEQCEDAVLKSLRWFQKTQNSDGSWGKGSKIAYTGMAILAYLAHCDTPSSEEFGDTVTRGIVYLIDNNIKNNGRMASNFKNNHWCYEHAIATYALAEAATFCNKLSINIPKLNEATKAAGDWIIDHQSSSGSWIYNYARKGGDNSIGLWHIQALKACKHTGLWKDNAFNSCITRALSYIKKTQDKNGGIGYNSPHPHAGMYTMTGAGMLAYQMWGKSHSSVVRKGAKYVRENAKFDYNGPESDLYRHYYYVQAMINRGGEDWVFYNHLFRDQILKNQNPDGSYKDVGGGKKVNAIAPQFKGKGDDSVIYRTALCTFMLEAYYRFLPATGAKTH